MCVWLEGGYFIITGQLQVDISNGHNGIHANCSKKGLEMLLKGQDVLTGAQKGLLLRIRVSVGGVWVGGRSRVVALVY